MIEVTIRIATETGELTSTEEAVLAALSGTGTATITDAAPAPVESVAAPAAPAPAKATRKPRQTRSSRAAVLEETEEQPEPPEDADEDVMGGDADEGESGSYTLDDAVQLATDAMNAKKTAKIKAALKAAGGAKVRDLDEDQIQVFCAKMSE